MNNVTSLDHLENNAYVFFDETVNIDADGSDVAVIERVCTRIKAVIPSSMFYALEWTNLRLDSLFFHYNTLGIQRILSTHFDWTNTYLGYSVFSLMINIHMLFACAIQL